MQPRLPIQQLAHPFLLNANTSFTQILNDYLGIDANSTRLDLSHLSVDIFQRNDYHEPYQNIVKYAQAQISH